ncbi:hypothetical protein [Bradyrhizobium glycinis]|uniref:hypothetical protein n=1 Tax=Bradyrhizobium glycinis TaxID=2751812 RepID=UPI0018DA0974|nr:hypothetical protein [Bradyrhizobium glycinis]MBH5371585.1 hypothetical protein [Bradyrhizobium glycinis]
MWLKKPRISPVPDAAITAAQVDALEPFFWRPRNDIVRTLANNAEALTSFTPRLNYFSSAMWLKHFSSPKNHLRGRVLEIVILRTAFLCKSGYEWSHHVNSGRRVG